MHVLIAQVLYYMFSNPKKDQYKLQTPDVYPYFSNPLDSTGVGDAKGVCADDTFELFAEVVTAMVDVGFACEVSVLAYGLCLTR